MPHTVGDTAAGRGSAKLPRAVRAQDRYRSARAATQLRLSLAPSVRGRSRVWLCSREEHSEGRAFLARRDCARMPRILILQRFGPPKASLQLQAAGQGEYCTQYVH